MKYLYITFFILCYQNCLAQFYSIKKGSIDNNSILLSPEPDEETEDIDDEGIFCNRDSVNQIFREQKLHISPPLKSIFITSSFGKRNDPFTKKTTRHSGIDLRANYENVYAILDSQVKKVGYDRRSGFYITFQQGFCMYSYCHLSKILIPGEGYIVKAGDIVAISGNSGRSTGPHLHITCRFTKDSKLFDPKNLLQLLK